MHFSVCDRVQDRAVGCVPSRPAARRTIRRHSARMMWRARTSALMFLTGNDLICSDWSCRTRTWAEVSCLTSSVRSSLQEFSLVGDEQSLWFSLICVFVSPTWFSHTDGPPLCKTTSSPTLWPICEVTEQRWERCTIFLALVLWYIFFYGRNFRQIWSSREVNLQRATLWNSSWTDDGMIYWYIIKVPSITCTHRSVTSKITFTQSCFSCLSSCPCFILIVRPLPVSTSPVWAPSPHLCDLNPPVSVCELCFVVFKILLWYYRYFKQQGK